MDGLQALIVTTIAGIVVGAIVSGVRQGQQTVGPENFTVRFHGGVLAIGIISMLLFGGFLYLSDYALREQGTLSQEDVPFVFGVFSFFFLLGAVLTVAAIRFRLRMEPGRIAYTPILGRSHVIRPEDIAYVVVTVKLKAYDKNHRKLFSVDPSCRGRASLEAWLRRHGVLFGRPVPLRQAIATRLQSFGIRRGKTYVTQADKQRSKSDEARRAQWEERQRLYMESPADLPDNLETLLREKLRPSVGLRFDDPAIHCVIGRSKFGGEPDLPPNFKWDYYEDYSYDRILANRPLAFLLQINCAEIKACCFESTLPREGLLSFFYEMDSTPWGPERVDRAGYVKVHYFKSTQGFVRTPLPESLKEEYHIMQHPIVPDRQASTPAFHEFIRGSEYSNNRANLVLYEQMRERVGVQTSYQGELAMNTRLFGWPESIQNDVFDEFTEFFLRDMDNRPIPEFERERMLATQPQENWELLLQLDSGTFSAMGAGSIMFGDFGNLYFGILKEDLRNERFDKTWFTLQCT